jgi:phosphoglycerate kinase
MKTINDFDVKNKRVLVRCDFNVPFDEKGNIENDFRIRQTIPTIKYLIKKGAEIVLMSHLAGDRGLDPVWERVKKYVSGDMKFLDNLRLNKGEEENSDEFAKELAQNGDIYVNDAFGVCHRNHASVVAITKYLPSAAGLLLEKELKVLSKIMENPDRPMVAVIGGVKLESKAKVVDRFLQTADKILIGGKIASEVKINSEKIVLAKDNVDGFDVGPETVEEFRKIIKTAKTIVWAGPLGFFEKKPYNEGTKKIAEEICKNKKAFKVAGGGETIAAIAELSLEKGFDHLSTGGGAMLAFLGGEELPGLKALNYYGRDQELK